LRVLVLSNLYPPDVIGGYELGCKQAVEALRRRGHEVRVLTSAPRTPAPSEPHVARRLRLSEVWNNYMYDHSSPVTARLLHAESTLINAFNVHALCEVVEDFRPEVAYPWMLVGVGGLGLMAALQHLGVPWLWHLMDDVPLALCRIGGRTVEPLLVEVARQLDGRYLACSSRLVEEIEAGGVRLRPDLTVIPNWVVGEAPPPRSKFYEPGRALRIMAAGQIAQHKGSDHIIEMAVRLRDRGFERFSIDFYGLVDDLYFPSLVKVRGLEGHVAFKGTRSQAELARLYPDYDIFAFPTWAREPFAFAPLEAMWRGCVPLMSQASGNAEWAVHGVHCLKAERTPDAFADAVGAILDGSIDLEPIARRGAAVVGRDFHLEAQIPRIERALTEAARGPRPQPAGSTEEAYRLALLAEKLTRVLVQEAEAADSAPSPADPDSSDEADPPDTQGRIGPGIADESARPDSVDAGGTPRDGTPCLL
jgi:glycogen synthase